MSHRSPWYAGEHQEPLFYLLIAIFFLELIVGGIAFFYGIIHARPEVEGGPPLAQFPWLAWAIAALLSPVGLLLVIHLAGSWTSGILQRDNDKHENDESKPAYDADLPESMRRFYASVRHAPTIVLLCAILGLGGALFFVDGAIATLGHLGAILLPYIPWLAVSIAALLAVCFIAHAFFVYRQRKMEKEFAWRREVLEKTGLVLLDEKKAITIDGNMAKLPEASSIIEVRALPPQTDKNRK